MKERVNCGAELENDQDVCPNCGALQDEPCSVIMSDSDEEWARYDFKRTKRAKRVRIRDLLRVDLS